MKFTLKPLLLTFCFILVSLCQATYEIKIGEESFKVSTPETLVSPNMEDEYIKAFVGSVTSPDSQVLSFFSTPNIVDPEERKKSSSDAVMFLYIFTQKNLIDAVFSDADFELIVQNAKQKMGKGVEVDATDSENYKEMQKKIQEFAKSQKTDVTTNAKPISFGPISESSSQITVLMKNFSLIESNGAKIPQEGFILTSYIHLKSKLLITMSARTNNSSVNETDLSILLKMHEKFINDLIVSNTEPGKAPKLRSFQGYQKEFSQRRSRLLNDVEKKLVGKFKGSNRELKWEIDRKSDGTFDMVIIQVVEGSEMTDFIRGVWGTEDKRYYVMDLQSLNRYVEGSPEKMWEQIGEITEDKFFAISEGLDGEKLSSPEERVSEFKFSLWKKFNK